MATNTTPALPPVRLDPRQVANELSITVNYNDASVGTGINFANSLPAGARILDVQVEVITAFNAGTTNVLTVGTNAGVNNIVASTDVNAGSTGVTKVTRGLGRSITAGADKTPQVKFAQTGTAATAGQAVITITYDGGFSS